MSLTSRLLTVCLTLLSFTGLPLSASTQTETRYPLRLLVVMGHSRYAAADILKTAGLTTYARVTPSEMSAACESLVRTGLFEKVTYHYTLAEDETGPGYQLTLQVVENPKLYRVNIAVPGMSEDELWADLKGRNPLLAAEMPITSEAWLIENLQQVLHDRGRTELVKAELATDTLFSGAIQVVLVPKAVGTAQGL
jgi:outer membrane protein assembly factor BamA